MIFVSIALLFLCIFSGVPVCFAFLTTVIYFLVSGGYDPGFMFPTGVSKMGSVVLFAIPMFIMAGGIIAKANIGDKLIDLVEGSWLGRKKGGLGAIAVISCALFGSITGSASATLSCIGAIMLPRLEKAGYSRGYRAALMTNASVLGMLIPPSALMIVYAWVGGQSVLASFLAIVLPGIMLTILFVIINFILLRNDPNLLLVNFEGELQETKRKRVLAAFPAMMLPVIVLGGIYTGVMTPTEAAAVSVAYSILIGRFVYHGLSWANLKECVLHGASATGSIMILIFCVMILSRIYVMEDLPFRILQVFYAISTDKYMVLIMINIFLLILGCLMDDTSAVLLSTPILVPMARELGISPVQLAAIIAVNVGMAGITPPCAPLLYFAGNMAKAPINEMAKPTVIFILFALLPTLIVTTYIPSFSLFLPRLILGM